MKLSTEGSVGDRRQVSQATEIATTVPEAIVSIGPSIPVMLLKKRELLIQKLQNQLSLMRQVKTTTLKLLSTVNLGSYLCGYW